MAKDRFNEFGEPSSEEDIRREDEEAAQLSEDEQDSDLGGDVAIDEILNPIDEPVKEPVEESVVPEPIIEPSEELRGLITDEARALAATPVPIVEKTSKQILGETLYNLPEKTDAPISDEVEVDTIPTGLTNVYQDAFYDKNIGGQALDFNKIAEVSAELNNGKAQWMSYTDVATGRTSMVAQTGTGEFLTAQQISGSINKAASEIEKLSGKGSAVAWADAITVLASPMQDLNPAYDKDTVIRSMAKTFVEFGQMTEAEVESIGDDSVEVGQPVEMNTFQEYIRGGAELRNTGESMLNVVTATLSAVATDPKFLNAGPKQKAQIIERTYETTLQAATAVDATNLTRIPGDQAQVSAQVASLLKSNSRNPETYQPATLKQRTSAQKTKDAAGISLAKLNQSSAETSGKLAEISAQVDAALTQLGVNTKSHKQEMRGRIKDGSEGIMESIESIRRSDPDKAGRAAIIYQQYTTGRSIMINHEQQRAIYTGQIKASNDVLTNGIAIDITKVYDSIDFMDGTQINQTTGGNQPDYWASVQSADNPEMEMLTILNNKTFTQAKKDNPELEQTYSRLQKEYQVAINNGTVSEMPEGEEMLFAVNQMANQFARRNQQDQSMALIDAAENPAQLETIPQTGTALEQEAQARAKELKVMEWNTDLIKNGSTAVSVASNSRSGAATRGAMNEITRQVGLVNTPFEDQLKQDAFAANIEAERRLRTGLTDDDGKQKQQTNLQNVTSKYQLQLGIGAETSKERVDTPKEMGEIYGLAAKDTVTQNPLFGTRAGVDVPEFKRSPVDAAYRQWIAVQGVDAMIASQQQAMEEQGIVIDGKKAPLNMAPRFVEARKLVTNDARQLSIQLSELAHVSEQDYKESGVITGDYLKKVSEYNRQKDAFLAGASNDPGSWAEVNRIIAQPLIQKMLKRSGR